jgi:adenosylcobinamide-GDP ribazoletransferase
VGLIIGLFISVFFFAVNLFLPLLLSVIFTVIFEVIITGAAHIDGLADMFDGVFSGRKKKEEILAIMKKSDVGMFGILAIVFMVILKVALLYFFARTAVPAKIPLPGDLTGFYVFLLFMPGFGRWSMNYMMASYKNGRKGPGLAKIFTEDKNKSKYFNISTIYFFFLYLLLVLGGNILRIYLEDGAVFGMSSCPIESFRIHLFAAVLLVLAVMMLLIIIQGWFFTRRTKGVTGDIVGGISEITEVLFLLVSFLALNYAY